MLHLVMPEDAPGAATMISRVCLEANPSIVLAVISGTLAWTICCRSVVSPNPHGRIKNLSNGGCASRSGSATPSASSALNALGHNPIALPSRLGPSSRSMTLTGIPTCSAYVLNCSFCYQ